MEELLNLKKSASHGAMPRKKRLENYNCFNN